MIRMPCGPEADATLVNREMPGLEGQVVDRASIHPFSIASTDYGGEGLGRMRDVPHVPVARPDGPDDNASRSGTG